MSTRNRRLLVGLYLLSAALVFLYIGFPSEALRAHVTHSLSAGLPGLSVAIGDMRPALPAGIVLKGVRVYHANVPLAVIEQLRIHPDLFSLWQAKTHYDFDGTVGEGQIAGTAETDTAGGRKRVSLNARLAGVLLQKLPATQSLYGNKLAGRLDGTLGVNDAGALTGKLAVSEGRVELATPLFDQNGFSFRTAEADLSLQNRTVMVRNGRMKGNDMDAEVSGTISLDLAQGKNALNLSGRVTPHPAFLAKVEGSLPPTLLRRRTGISFKVSGALNAPGFSFN
jgi:type II secretion system protein N